VELAGTSASLDDLTTSSSLQSVTRAIFRNLFWKQFAKSPTASLRTWNYCLVMLLPGFQTAGQRLQIEIILQAMSFWKGKCKHGSLVPLDAVIVMWTDDVMMVKPRTCSMNDRNLRNTTHKSAISLLLACACVTTQWLI